MTSVAQQSLVDYFNSLSDDHVLVFDLDSTILDTRPVYGPMEKNYAHFLAQRLGMPYQAAYNEVQDMLKQTYYIQLEAYKRHGIPLIDTIKVAYDPNSLNFSSLYIDPKVKPVLDAIQRKKYVLTNASEAYGHAVVGHAGLKSCFDGVAGTDTYGCLLKPDKDCYDAFEAHFGLAGKTIHFFEDMLDNLEGAHRHNGWIGHLVEGHRTSPAFQPGQKVPSYVHARLDTLVDLSK